LFIAYTNPTPIGRGPVFFHDVSVGSVVNSAMQLFVDVVFFVNDPGNISPGYCRSDGPVKLAVHVVFFAQHCTIVTVTYGWSVLTVKLPFLKVAHGVAIRTFNTTFQKGDHYQLSSACISTFGVTNQLHTVGDLNLSNNAAFGIAGGKGIQWRGRTEVNAVLVQHDR
jgi:hypothetical protein